MSKAAAIKSDESALLFKRENPSNPSGEQVQYVYNTHSRYQIPASLVTVFSRLTVDERIKRAKEQERESRKAALVRTII